MVKFKMLSFKSFVRLRFCAYFVVMCAYFVPEAIAGEDADAGAVFSDWVGA